jgi:hypothetical protein
MGDKCINNNNLSEFSAKGSIKTGSQKKMALV